MCAEKTFAVSPLLRVFEAGVKANGRKRKVKRFGLPASALDIWHGPGHNNVTMVPLVSPLRIYLSLVFVMELQIIF